MNQDEKTLLRGIFDEIEERIRFLSDRLGKGGAKDYPEYRELCGHIQGLLFTQSTINDLVRKMEKHENE
jgi:hypothetical protein